MKLTGPQLELLQRVAIHPILVKYAQKDGHKTSITCNGIKVNALTFYSLNVELHLIYSRDGIIKRWRNGDPREALFRITQEGRDELATRAKPTVPPIVDPLISKPEWLQVTHNANKDIEAYTLFIPTTAYTIFVARVFKDVPFTIRMTLHTGDMSAESARMLGKTLEIAASLIEYRSHLDEVVKAF